MPRSMKLNFLAVAVFSVAGTAEARNLFVLPQGSGGDLRVYNGNPFSFVSNVPSIPDPLTALSNPQGSRVYVIGKSGTIAVLNPLNNYSLVTSYSLGSSIRAATISPNGRYLVIAAATVRIITVQQEDGTLTDTPGAIPQVDAGNIVEDVDVSLDSTTAFAVSSIARTVSAINLANGVRSAQVVLSQTPNGLGVSPNGMLYVSANGRLFEYDTRDGLTPTNPTGYQFDADPSKPVFTLDGQRVVMTNRAPTAAVSVIAFDTTTRSISTAGGLSQLGTPVMIGSNTGYALLNGRVYSIGASPASVGGQALGGLPDGIVAIAASDDFPAARSFYALYPNSVLRFDLATQVATPALTFPGQAAGLSFGGPTSPLPVTQVLDVSLRQPGPTNGVSFPVAIRAVDSTGRPISDLQVSFTSATAGLVVLQPSVRTGGAGLAATRIQFPSTPGTYIVRAQAGSAVRDISLVASTSGSGGGSTLFTIAGGNGQFVSGGALSNPFLVNLKDAQGNPVSNAAVNFTVKAGIGVGVISTVVNTDGNGNAGVLVSASAFTPSINDLSRPFTINAAVTTGSFTGSLDMYGVVHPAGQAPLVQLSTTLNATSGELLLPAGSLLADAFRAQINSGATGFPNLAVANGGIRVQNLTGGQTLRCKDDPVSNAGGIVSCNLLVGSQLGNGQLQVIVGESSQNVFTYNFRITPGVPSQMKIIQGDGQVGSPGTTTPRALVVEVQDSQGNPIRDAEVTWSIVSGDGVLTGVVNRSDVNGRASALVTFGSTPGTINVRASAAGIQANFALTNNSPVGQFVIVSGNAQSAALNAAFAAPLVVRALNPAGGAIVGANVAFRVDSGPVLLSSANATTNAQGEASITVTAGATTGAAKITATLAASSVTFDLTVTPAGPRITSVVLGAGFRPGVVACSIATIRGNGFLATPGTFSGPMVGPLPTTLAGVSVTVGNIPAPIFAVINQDGSEQINIQVPCELPVATHVLRVTSLGQSANFDLALAGVSPGIFEFTGTAGRQGVVVKSTGIFVTPETPAVHGETVTGYFTGLPVGPGQFSNQPGLGQSLPVDGIIIGLGNQGMTVLRAQYAMNLIGVYTVQFIVDASAGTGNVPYAIAAQTPSGLVFGNPSVLPVRAQ